MVHNGTITRFVADDNVLYQWVRRDVWLPLTGFRQQLSTTLFEACELEITANYTVHTWTENGSFTRNLTSWSVPFWLVFLTKHKVLHCCAPNTTAAWLSDNCTRLVDFLQQTVDASKFPTLVGQFTQQPSCTILLLGHQHSPHWKSQIAHSDMHQRVSGINSLIHSVSLASSIHLLTHLSPHFYHHHHSHHPSLFHSFSPGS